jgi:hypothetical protein
VFGEFIADTIASLDLLERKELLNRIGTYAALSPEALQLVGGDRLPALPLVAVPDAA